MKKAKVKKKRPTLKSLEHENRALRAQCQKSLGRAGKTEMDLRHHLAVKNEPPPWISDVWVASNRAIERMDNAIAVINRVSVRDGKPEDFLTFFPDKIIEDEWTRRTHHRLFGAWPGAQPGNPHPLYEARNAVITKLYERQARTP